MFYLFLILWGVMSITAILPYLIYCHNLTTKNKLIVILIFIIGGPIFSCNQILITILDTIFPEGWDNDDFDSRY